MNYRNFSGTGFGEARFLGKVTRAEVGGAGVEKTDKMPAKPSATHAILDNYFNKLGGKFFSITRRKDMLKDKDAQKGVKALQQALKDAGIYEQAQAELQAPNSEFRKAVEGEMMGDSGVQLFSASLRKFDKEGEKMWSDAADGAYGHATRLAVAYVQWLAGVKVDGAFGKGSMKQLEQVEVEARIKALEEATKYETAGKLRDFQESWMKEFVEDGGGAGAPAEAPPAPAAEEPAAELPAAEPEDDGGSEPDADVSSEILDAAAVAARKEAVRLAIHNISGRSGHFLDPFPLVEGDPNQKTVFSSVDGTGGVSDDVWARRNPSGAEFVLKGKDAENFNYELRISVSDPSVITLKVSNDADSEETEMGAPDRAVVEDQMMRLKGIVATRSVAGDLGEEPEEEPAPGGAEPEPDRPDPEPDRPDPDPATPPPLPPAEIGTDGLIVSTALATKGNLRDTVAALGGSAESVNTDIIHNVDGQDFTFKLQRLSTDYSLIYNSRTPGGVLIGMHVEGRDNPGVGRSRLGRVESKTTLTCDFVPGANSIFEKGFSLEIPLADGEKSGKVKDFLHKVLEYEKTIPRAMVKVTKFKTETDKFRTTPGKWNDPLNKFGGVSVELTKYDNGTGDGGTPDWWLDAANKPVQFVGQVNVLREKGVLVVFSTTRDNPETSTVRIFAPDMVDEAGAAIEVDATVANVAAKLAEIKGKVERAVRKKEVKDVADRIVLGMSDPDTAFSMAVGGGSIAFTPEAHDWTKDKPLYKLNGTFKGLPVKIIVDGVTGDVQFKADGKSDGALKIPEQNQAAFRTSMANAVRLALIEKITPINAQLVGIANRVGLDVPASHALNDTLNGNVDLWLQDDQYWYALFQFVGSDIKVGVSLEVPPKFKVEVSVGAYTETRPLSSIAEVEAYIHEVKGLIIIEKRTVAVIDRLKGYGINGLGDSFVSEDLTFKAVEDGTVTEADWLGGTDKVYWFKSETSPGGGRNIYLGVNINNMRMYASFGADDAERTTNARNFDGSKGKFDYYVEEVKDKLEDGEYAPQTAFE